MAAKKIISIFFSLFFLALIFSISNYGVIANSTDLSVYVANRGDWTVSKIDSSTNVVVNTIPVGTEPHVGDGWGSVAASPDGKSIAIGTGTGLSIIDTNDDGVINLPIYARNLVFSPDSERIYLLSTDDKVHVVDIASKTEIASISLYPGLQLDLSGIAISPDGSRVYVTDHTDTWIGNEYNFFVIDTSSNIVVNQLFLTDPFGANDSARGLAVSSDGNTTYVAGNTNLWIIDNTTYTYSTPEPENGELGGGIDIAVNSDDTKAYIAGSDLFVYDIATSQIQRINTDASCQGVSVSPDDSKVYVSCENNRVEVYDGSTLQLISSITVGNDPKGVAVQQPLANPPADSFAPTTTISYTPAPNTQGWVTEDVTVTLSVQDDGGSGVKQTEYSLDGGSTWNLYNSLFTISEEGIINLLARSEDNVGNLEEPVSEEIKIDKNSPSTIIHSDGDLSVDGTVYYTDVEITLTATDNASGVSGIEYSLDNGSTWVDYSSAFFITQEGETAIMARSTDNAGNTELPVEEIVTITRDTQGPVNTITADGELGHNGWYISPITVSVTAEDDISGLDYIEYQTDYFNWNLYTNPFEYPIEGINSIFIRSFDNAGNQSVETEFQAKLDYSPPVVFVDLNGVQGENGWFVSPVTVTLNAEDSISGIEKVEFSFDGVNWFNYSTPIELTDQGVPGVWYRAEDVAGNKSEPQQVLIPIDTSNPGIGFLDLSTYTVATGETVEFSASAEDGVSGISTVKYLVDGVEQGEMNRDVNTGIWKTQLTLTTGVYALDVEVKDVAGLTSNSSAEGKTIYLAVYDPEAGFVTGGGISDLTTGDRATLGFQVKYSKDSYSEPQGKFRFNTPGGEVLVESEVFDWLVVGTESAEFQGVGTVNGDSGYIFRFAFVDGDPDTFSLRVWHETNGSYDNPLYSTGVETLNKGNLAIH